MEKDYYKVLSVSRDCSHDEIKKAFRKLALKYHPDRNPDNPESEKKFKEAAAAYEILGNKKKRSQYDQFGHTGVNSRFGQTGFHDMQDIFSSFKDIFDQKSFGNVGGGFESVFGDGGNANGASQRGSDLQFLMEISLLDVLKGTSKSIKYEVDRDCEDCKGSGASPGTDKTTCVECKGSGRLTKRQGFFAFSSTCPTCQGAGTFINSPCGVCFGVGRKKKVQKVEVSIPPGVKTGMQLKLSQKGESGHQGGATGDLYVKIKVIEESFLQRNGADLIGRVSISYLQAILGTKIKVPVLEGKIEITIPKGTQHGEFITIKNQGLAILNSKRKGNLLYQVQVKIPVKPKKKEEEALRNIAKIIKESVLDK